MDVETFLARLQKVRYFEGFSKAAAAKAIRLIRKNHAEGISGLHQADFERFPGLALVVTEVDLEMSGRDDLKLVLQGFGAASFGMFAPRSIQIPREQKDDTHQLRFSVNGNKYVWTFKDESWIPNEFFEELDKVTRNECSGLAFHAVAYPDGGQSGYFLWCTSRSFKAVTRAALIPSDKHPLHGEPAPPPPAKPMEPPAASVPELAAPADPIRAERMGLYGKKGWRIPSLSKKPLAAWREIAMANPTTLVGGALAMQIQHTFDLLCAIHVGLTGIGDATAYAKQVVALVDRYFFGAWRDGHVEDGVQLTQEAARKELLWVSHLQMGCAAAVFLEDYQSLFKFLDYPRHDVYKEYIEDELAYYRLLSDVVLHRSEWNWEEQTRLAESGGEERLPKLLSCLEALQAGNPSRFQKAICKLGTKPKFSPPFTYDGVVDCDTTLLAELARRRGWCHDDFPVRLQDKILDRRILS